MENSSNVQNLFQECLGDKQYKIRKFTVEVSNKNKKFRCNRNNGEKKNFSDEQEEVIKNWVIEQRTKHIPII